MGCYSHSSNPTLKRDCAKARSPLALLSIHVEVVVSFAEKLFAEIQRSPGLSDRELTDILCGLDKRSSE